MSRLLGRSNQAIMGSLKTMTINYQTPQETLQSTPTTLPIAEPSTPQISYTVQESDLPTFTGAQPTAQSFFGIIYAGGNNLSAANQTLNYETKKNGVSLTVGNYSVLASQFWTLNIFDHGFNDVKVGDVLEVYLWDTAGIINWDYNAYYVDICNVFVEKPSKILTNINIPQLSVATTLTKGNPEYISGTPQFGFEILFNIIVGGEAAGAYAPDPFPYNFGYRVLVQEPTYGLFTNSLIDPNYSGIWIESDSTYRPYYCPVLKIGTVSWRPTSIEL